GAPGTVKDAKLAPRITETAKTLGAVYAGLTAACALSLWAAGMSMFDAICHAFSTLALGGFSTHDANIGYFHSPMIEFVLMIFMLIAAMNFATHFIALRKGNFNVYRRDPEARWMLLLILGSCIAIAVFLEIKNVYADFFGSLRYAAFNVISLATDSGFVSTDYGSWPIFAPMWMLFLSCLCASTGSTGGGIKMFRSLILVKQSLPGMFPFVHPPAVMPLKISGLDFISALSAIVACINNAGPGLNLVGPAGNYSALNDFQSWISIAGMFLGRVEIITFAVLLTPTFWRK